MSDDLTRRWLRSGYVTPADLESGSVDRSAPEYGPFLEDYHGMIPCLYEGPTSDDKAVLVGFVRSAYRSHLAMIQVRGMTLSVPMNRVSFPAWMRER